MTAWNEQLRQHRLRRGLTQEEVAAELARVAWEQNHAHVGVDGAMVSKWECGRKQPSRTYRRLIASVFGDEQLAFVGPDDLADLGLEFARSIADAVETVDTLARADMERRAFLQSALFGVAASAVPSRDWLLATIEEAGSPAKRIGAAQVEAIRRTFGIFHELDVTRGGGHARHQLAGYFTSSVVPLLRSNDASTDAGRELYEAGAEHVRLIGWMAFDDGESALAQRYFIQGLRLAHEARSPELGAYILTGLSHQAITAGRPDQGLQLTRAGRAGLRHGHSPACLADL